MITLKRSGSLLCFILLFCSTAFGQVTTLDKHAGRDYKQYPAPDYGVVGDSATDNTVKLQALIDMVVSLGGGTITFPAGTYVLNDTIILDIGLVSLVGDNVTFDFSALTTGTALSFINTDTTYQSGPFPWNQSSRTIRGIRLLGDDKTEATVGIAYTIDVLRTDDPAFAHITIEDVAVTQFGTGMYFTSNAYLINHIGCEIFQNGTGIVTERSGSSQNYGEKLSFFGCTIYANTLQIEQWDAQLFFSNCSFDDPSTNDYQLEINAGYTYFEQCHFEGGVQIMNQVVTHESWVSFVNSSLTQQEDGLAATPFITATRNLVIIGGDIRGVPDSVTTLILVGASAIVSVIGTDVIYGGSNQYTITSSGEMTWMPLEGGVVVRDSINIMMPTTGSTLDYGLNIIGPTTGRLGLVNSSGSLFAPTMKSVASHTTAAGLLIRAQTYVDDGSTEPSIVLQAKDPDDNSAIDAGDVLAIRNWGTDVFEIDYQGAVTYGGVQYPTSDGSVGEAMITDGSGNADWGSVSSGSDSTWENAYKGVDGEPDSAFVTLNYADGLSGTGQTNVLVDTGTADGASAFGLKTDKVGSQLRIRMLLEGLGIAMAYDGDTAISIAATLGASVDLAAEVTGELPNANVADDITASNYLPLAAGAGSPLTGSLYTDGPLISLNTQGGTASGTLGFFEGGTASGAYLTFDTVQNKFTASNPWDFLYLDVGTPDSLVQTRYWIQAEIADSLDEYSLTSAIPGIKSDDAVMSDSTQAILDGAVNTNDYADQSIKGDHIDSTAEDFTFSQVFKGTSAVADSQLVTKGYADGLGGSGEVNTLGDTGTFNDTEGFGLAGGKTTTVLKVKGLIEGSGITIAQSGDSALTITSSAGGGNVSKVGTPVNNQVAVWTGDGTVEGDDDLTFDGTDLTTTGDVNADNFVTTGSSSGTITLTGETSGSASITVADIAGTPSEIVLPTSDGSSGDQLTTDGAGVTSWEAAGGSAALDSAEVAAIVRDSVLNFESAFEAVLDLEDLQGAVTDGQVPNGITIDLATLATTVTVTDDEATEDEQEIVFTTDNTNLESDGDFTYNPLTGTVTATEFVGGGGGLTGLVEVNNLETDDPPNVATTEIYIGTGPGAGAWSVLSGDVTMENDGEVNVTYGAVLLDELGDPADAKTFQMGNNVMVFSYNGPVGSDGAFEIEAAGGFSGDLVHIHQHTGNPSAVDLLHLQADDADVILLRAMGAGDTLAVMTGGKVVFDSVVVVGRIRVDSLDADKYTDLSIDRPDLANDIIDGTKIADNAVDSEHYTDQSIDSAHLALGILDSIHLGTNSISLSGNIQAFSSADLLDRLSDETGTGLAVFGTNPVFADSGHFVDDLSVGDDFWVGGNITLDDGAGNSPTLIFTDGDNETLSIEKQDAGAATISNSEGAIRIQPSGDVNDYLYVTTTTGVVTLTTQAGDDGDLVISSGGGDISFSDDNLSGTGAVDFGGAISFEIPNANDPATTVEGQVAWDVNNDMMEVYDGTQSIIIAGKLKYFQVTIDQPDQLANDTVMVLCVEAGWAPFGITLVDLGIKTRAATTYAVDYIEFTQPDNGGTETHVDATITTSASTEAEDDGSLTNAGIAAGNILMADLDTDDIDQVVLWGTFYINPGN